MVKHFSLLFELRSEAVVEVHSRLCSTVLGIFQKIAKQASAKAMTLSEETWEVILRLLIGMGDYLFLSPHDPSPLGQRLCNQMLRVLFECWLVAETFRPLMWNYLTDRVSKWTHIPQTIAQWQSVSLALTQRMLRFMYGPGHGSESVVIKIDKEQTILNLKEEYIMYAWQRVLRLLQDLNTIPTPSNFLAAFTGVDTLVSEFLNVKENLPSNVLPPNGNTVLHIFGKWLFEAIQLNRRGFEEGTSLAIKTLSGVFTDRQNCVFLNTYLASYYRCLQEILLSDGRPLVALILNTQNLLTQGMNGSRVLVQHYIYAIFRIINSDKKHLRADNVRRASLQILSLLICYPKFFGNAELKLKLTQKERQAIPSSSAAKGVFDAKTYSDLRPFIDNILSDALKDDNTTPNFLLILQLCFCHSCIYIDENSEFARNTITMIVGKCVTPKKWGQVVHYEGLSIVSRMVFLLPHLTRGRELAGKIVGPLCGYVSGLCTDLYRPREEGDKQLIRLAVQTFHTIATWIMEGQWVVRSLDRLENVLDAIAVGICGPKQKQDNSSFAVDPKKVKKEKKDKKSQKGVEDGIVLPHHSKKIVRAAKYLLRCLLNRLGCVPPPKCGISSVSTLITEDELVESIIEKAKEKGHTLQKKQLLRSFILQDQTLVTVIDHPYEDDGPKSTMLLRDATGRYCWKCSQAYLPFKERGLENRTAYHCKQPVKISSGPHQTQALPLEETRVEAIYDYLSQRKLNYDPHCLATEMVNSETSVLEAQSYHIGGLDMTLNPPPPADAYTSNCQFQQGRLLMTHLGFLALENWGKLQPLEQSAGYYSLLRSLDEVPERPCLKVSVIFSKPQQSLHDSMLNQGGSLAYQEFISSLGWGVHIPTHTGYLGGLERKPAQHGEFALYYASHSLELIYHVASLMPNSDLPEQAHKLRLVGANYVAIVWHEGNLEEYVPDFGHSCLLQIVISPIFTGCLSNLYQIRLFCKKSVSTKFWDGEKQALAVFGPAMDGMILSKERLGVLVRETAISATNTLLDMVENFKRAEPFEARLKVISDIAKKYKAPESFEGLNTSLFSANPNKAIAPTADALSRSLRNQFLEVFNEFTSEHRLPSSSSPFHARDPLSPSHSFSPASPSPQNNSSQLSPPSSPRSPRDRQALPLSPGRAPSPQGLRIHQTDGDSEGTPSRRPKRKKHVVGEHDEEGNDDSETKKSRKKGKGKKGEEEERSGSRVGGSRVGGSRIGGGGSGIGESREGPPPIESQGSWTFTPDDQTKKRNFLSGASGGSPSKETERPDTTRKFAIGARAENKPQ